MLFVIRFDWNSYRRMTFKGGPLINLLLHEAIMWKP